MSASAGVFSWQAQCARKRTYRNKHGVKRAIGQAQSHLGGRAMVAYRCPWCGLWHAGHRPATEVSAHGS